MCNPALALIGTGTALNVVGGIQQGKATQQAYDNQAANEDYQGAVDQDNALAQAQLIRRQGESDRGSSIVAAAASGVKVGQGSAGDAERKVMQDAETDAGLAILNGQRSARTHQTNAANLRASGRAARTASYVNAFSSLLSAGAQGMQASGFRANGVGFSGTQAPAPVVDRSIRY